MGLPERTGPGHPSVAWSVAWGRTKGHRWIGLRAGLLGQDCLIQGDQVLFGYDKVIIFLVQWHWYYGSKQADPGFFH